MVAGLTAHPAYICRPYDSAACRFARPLYLHCGYLKLFSPQNKSVSFAITYASHWRIRSVPAASPPPYLPPHGIHHAALQNADAQKVQDAIQHLNRNEQTVIQFYYFRQETTNEIAVRLGCSVQNVRKIKRRALTRLRSLLER